MRYTVKWLIAFLIVGLIPNFGFSQNPVLERHPLTTGYVPQGFDDNDNVQVTAEGWFSDTCYKVGDMQAKVSGPTVALEQMAYRYLGIMCLEIMVPFHQTVNLGVLKRGHYQVYDSVSSKPLGTLPVGLSRTASPDDFLYAPVTDANIRVAQGQLQITINGVFTDSCMVVSDVRSRLAKNVLEVLPIAVHASKPDCMKGIFPFQKTFAVARPANGRYLLHMRTLDGNSINQMIDIF